MPNGWSYPFSFLLVVSIVCSTVQGLRWFLQLTAETKPDFELSTIYYVEAFILLAIPISIAAFFLIILLILLVFVAFEYRRNRLRSWQAHD